MGFCPLRTRQPAGHALSRGLKGSPSWTGTCTTATAPGHLHRDARVLYLSDIESLLPWDGQDREVGEGEGLGFTVERAAACWIGGRLLCGCFRRGSCPCCGSSGRGDPGLRFRRPRRRPARGHGAGERLFRTLRGPDLRPLARLGLRLPRSSQREATTWTPLPRASPPSRGSGRKPLTGTMRAGRGTFRRAARPWRRLAEPPLIP